MAITAWVNIGPGVTPSTLAATPGIVVNGAHNSTPASTTGRLYPT